MNIRQAWFNSQFDRVRSVALLEAFANKKGAEVHHINLIWNRLLYFSKIWYQQVDKGKIFTVKS